MANAQINLGVCYFCGHGVTQDYTKAVKWFRKAAEQGLAVAQNNLGWCYEHGEGVTQDYVKAKEWYRKAADQGNAKAKNNLDRLRLLDKKDQDEITKPKQNAKPL
ncbi:MAG: sel1 repeat family protein [Ruminococcus sp.]|nr:sel1 repeat family protein [Ruminococcus sp.]